MDVSLEEVSCVVRLVREVGDLWDDPCAWRQHLLQGACRLLNGHVGMMLADHGGEAECFGQLTVISSVGVPAPLQSLLQATISQADYRMFDDVDEDLSPGTSKLYAEIVRQGWVTAMGSQLANEGRRHSSSIYQNIFKQLDCDDSLVSIRIVDVPRRPEAINIARPHGSIPFGERELALLKLLHDEISPLVGLRLATEDHICRDGLSKRLRETLSLLLEGYSEKQVASTLQLGARTVHDYVTRLYEHFQVCSRAELLAYFVRRRPAPRDPPPL